MLTTRELAVTPETSCPKCGQRMRIPQPETPATRNRTVLGQLTSSLPVSPPRPEPSTISESDSLALLGLRKDSEPEGSGQEQAGYKPAGSWAGTAFAALALTLAVVAMPVAIVHHPLFGAGLAGLGVFFGTLALFAAVKRRGAGCGLSLAGMAICGSVLFTAIMLYGKNAASDNRRTQADAAKQNYRDSGTGEREPESEADPAEPKRQGERNGDAPKRQSRRHEAEESPAERKPKRPARFRTEVDRLIEQLKGEKTDDRIAAAERLQKMGEKARPAARALCEAIVSPSESVRRSALEALEKVDPALYKQVVLLVVDENANNHVQASKALAGMGAEGGAAVPVILSHAKNLSQDSSPGYHQIELLSDIAALAKLGPGEPEVVELFKELTKFQKARYIGSQVRSAAINALVATGKSQPARRKELVPVLVAATKITVFGRHDEATCIASIKALGEFGPDAKAAIASLKDLKLSSSMRVRDAARVALDKIEKDAEE